MQKKCLSLLCTVLVWTLLFCACCSAAAEVTVDVVSGSVPFLVNKDHPVAEDFVPAGLISLKGNTDEKLVTLKYKDLMAVREAVDALNEMLDAAAADGVKNWKINAAYRSIAEQQRVLENKISSTLKDHPGWSRSRARTHALNTVAEPCCSEHHLGLAIDITAKGASAFKGTKQCKWLHAHCWDYGFIIRYQEGKQAITGFAAEEWHIRYVGVEHALAMRDQDLCLEEYLETLPEEETGARMEIEEITPEDLGL